MLKKFIFTPNLNLEATGRSITVDVPHKLIPNFLQKSSRTNNTFQASFLRKKSILTPNLNLEATGRSITVDVPHKVIPKF